MRGKFITFEGSEGSGKSTQSRLLYAFLKRKGIDVIYVREPGGTKVGEKIRKILLDPANITMTAECEMLLYMACRTQIVSEVIEPALKKGISVICDRILDSTLAYQGYGLGMDLGAIRSVGKIATKGLKPDLTIFLDLPVKKGLAKCNRVKDRIEIRSFAFHHRVRNGYLKLARQEPDRIKIVRVDDHKAETQKKIRGLVRYEGKNVV